MVAERTSFPADGSRKVLDAPLPTALAGCLAAILSLACGRWGSYLGFRPLYVTDLFVAGATARALMRSALSNGVSNVDGIRASRAAIFLPLLVWSGLRFVLGLDHGFTALRDFAPYAYSVLGVLAARSVARSTPQQRAWVGRLLIGALAAHAIWMFVVVVLAPSLPNSMPLLSGSEGVHVLSVRNDFDSAVTGVFAAIALTALLRGVRPVLAAGCLVGAWSAILVTNSRAGMLAAIVANVIAGRAVLGSDQVGGKARLAIVGVVPLALAAAALLLPHTNPGTRLLSGFGLGGSRVQTTAAGTTHARSAAWADVLRYSMRDDGRFLFGVGFGPDFMSSSGALTALVGPEPSSTAAEPRSPHSYWLGTLARLGLVGLVLFAALSTALARRIVARFRDLCHEPLLMIAALVPAALVIPFSAGVVMESPFGAVAFFWCAGILFGYPAGQMDELGVTRPLPSFGKDGAER